MAAKGSPKGCLNACCAMTRHLLALIALRAAGAAACDMCSVHCDGCEILEPTCSGLSQKDKDRWRTWKERTTYDHECHDDVCCASDEEDCCEPNVGAIAGLVFALADVVFLVWLYIYLHRNSIYGYCKHKGGKLKEPDEEARHGDSSEPAPCPVDPLTVPCPSCRSRVVHNSGEGKDAFFKCSSCSRYLTYCQNDETYDAVPPDSIKLENCRRIHAPMRDWYAAPAQRSLRAKHGNFPRDPEALNAWSSYDAVVTAFLDSAPGRENDSV